MSVPERNWVWRCQVGRVVDGDTVYCLVDNGFRNREWHAIRLAGVDTPEIFRGDDDERAAGLDAKEQVIDWVVQHDKASGSDFYERFPFTLQTDRDRQSFNRYIGTIWADNGDNLNDYLIGLGYGAT